MDVTLQIWSAGIFFIAGLMIGRLRWSGYEMQEGLQETGEQSVYEGRTACEEKSVRGVQGGRILRQGLGGKNKKREQGEKKIPLGWAVGSPVAGAVKYFQEGTRRGAMILPEQGMLYAPLAGKVTRVFPTGNAMLLRTDSGIEILMQVGVHTEELEGRHFRARIVKNEVVNKGKPLLEFDVEGIRSEGYDPSVTVSVEDAGEQSVTVCGEKRVKVGEHLMWVRG